MPLTSALGSLLALLIRRKRLILGLFVAIGGAVALFILSQPDRYVATTTLIAKFGREHTYRPDAGGNVVVPTAIGPDEIVNSTIEIMRAGAVADQVVGQIGAETLYPGLADDSSAGSGTDLRRAAVLRFNADLKVSPVRRSNVIVVEFPHRDPEIAAATLHQFVDAFQAKYLALHGENRVEFLEREVERARADLASARETVSTFERKSGIYAQDGQIDDLLRRRADFETQRERVMRCCAESSSAADLTRQVADLDRRIAALSAARTELRDLVRRRDLAQEAYDAALRRAQEARISRGLDESRITSVQVIDSAVPPVRPARPGKPLKLLLALAFVGIGSLAAAFIAEALSRTFSTAAQVRRTFQVPVLADVPYWNSVKE